MDSTSKTKAIVLQREPFNENDSRVFIYTENFGKLELIARGTQKLSSKLAAHLEPLNLGEIMVIKGKQYNYLGSVVSQEIFPQIKNDLVKIKIAGKAISLLNKIIKEKEADKEIFKLLKDFLYFIEGEYSKSEVPLLRLQIMIQVFTLKLMSLLGHQPEVYKCVICGKDLSVKNNKFSFNKGGVVCSQCVDTDAIQISNEAIKSLQLMLIEDIKVIKVIKEIKEVENIITKFRQYHFS